ncbi:MAG: hypothetical protein ABL891_08415 [Burkholderiales bacterium]
MHKSLAAIPILMIALCGCGTVAPTKIAPDNTPIPISDGSESKSFLLSRVVTRIPLGDRVLNIQYGWGCMAGNYRDWRGGGINLTQEEFNDGFRKELEKHRYKVAGDPSALFVDKSIYEAELLVAGAIEKSETNICVPFSGSPDANIGITSKMKGSTYMRIRWQIYNPATSSIVLEMTTEGAFSANEVIDATLPIFLKNVFQANLRNLLADSKFNMLARKDSGRSPDEGRRP